MRSWPLQLVSVTLVLLLTGSPSAAVVCDAVCAGAAAEVPASDASGAASAHDHAPTGDTAAHAAHGTAAHDHHTVLVHPATNIDADAARIGSDPRPCESHLTAPLPVRAARDMTTLLTPSTAGTDTTALCDAARPARLAQTHTSPPPDVSFLRAPIVLRI